MNGDRFSDPEDDIQAFSEPELCEDDYKELMIEDLLSSQGISLFDGEYPQWIVNLVECLVNKGWKK